MTAGRSPDPLTVLRGHHAEVQAMDFLDSEQLLFTGDAEGEVRAWDLQEFRPVGAWRAHPVSGGVLHLRAFCWQGHQHLVTQGKDMTFHIWRLGTELELPSEPTHTIRTMASSFCRFSLVAAPSTGQPGPGTSMAAVALEFASGRDGGSSAAAAAQRPMCSSEPGPSISPAPTESGTVGSGGAAARSSLQPPSENPAAAGPSAALLPHKCSAEPTPDVPAAEAQQPTPLLALPAGDNTTVEVWCCGCGRRLAVVGGSSVGGRKLGMCTSLQLFRPPGSDQFCLAAGYEAGWLAVWAVQPPAAASSGSASSASRASGSGARAGSSHGAGPAAAAATAEAAESLPLVARQLHEEPVLALDLDPSGAAGVSGGADARLVFFKLNLQLDPQQQRAQQQQAQQQQAEQAQQQQEQAQKAQQQWEPALKVRKAAALKAPGVNDLALRGDGKIVAAAGWDGRVRVFKCRTGEPLAVLKYHSKPVSAVRFSPVTQLLASASRDGTVALWSIYQPTPPVS